MSETTTEPTEPTTEQTQGEPAEALGEGGTKALQSERAARKAAEKALAERQRELDEIKNANLSELERAQKAAADARAEVEKLPQSVAQSLREHLIQLHNISDDDAELFLTGTSPDLVLKQAARLVERTTHAPKPDPSQGAKGAGVKGSTAEQFAEFFQTNI